jgi:hypothetical protein
MLRNLDVVQLNGRVDDVILFVEDERTFLGQPRDQFDEHEIDPLVDRAHLTVSHN